MNRRDAVKNISLAFGYTIATPTLLGILNSCSENGEKWRSDFFSNNQKYIIIYLVDIILPKTDFPGGLKLNLVQFIDKMVSHTITKKEQELFNKGSLEFMNKFKRMFNKTSIKGSREEYSKLLKTYFDIPKKEEQLVFKQLELDFKEVPKHKRSDYLIFKFLTLVRYYSLLGYYTSQKIKEEVQGYNPDLGYYKGCEDL